MQLHKFNWRYKVPVNYSKYPPNWRSEIRPRILARAMNKCELCGIPNYSLAKSGAVVILTIMHLDHDAANWQVDDSRLKAACQACHNAYDAQYRARNRHLRRQRHSGRSNLFEG